jgi:hypothetical protein
VLIDSEDPRFGGTPRPGAPPALAPYQALLFESAR